MCIATPAWHVEGRDSRSEAFGVDWLNKSAWSYISFENASVQLVNMWRAYFLRRSPRLFHMNEFEGHNSMYKVGTWCRYDHTVPRLVSI